MLQPIAFMVMPFGAKNVVLDQHDGNIPASVNFDLLWERVYEPALVQLGYQAVRADYDLGSLIINDMIQRLAVADLVLADVTLPNANVYYEIGVRHAAKQRGCVLLAADWSKPTFDLAQMRQNRFPLPDGQIPEEYAQETVKTLVALIGPRIDGTSPVFDAVVGYPDNIDEKLLPSFRRPSRSWRPSTRKCEGFSTYRRVSDQRRPATSSNGTVASRWFVTPCGSGCPGCYAIRAPIRKTGSTCSTTSTDCPPTSPIVPTSWNAARSRWRRRASSPAAAGLLEQLIDSHGGTSERYGLLGGRYKELMRVAHLSSDRQRYLTSPSRPTTRECDWT